MLTINQIKEKLEGSDYRLVIQKAYSKRADREAKRVETLREGKEMEAPQRSPRFLPIESVSHEFRTALNAVVGCTTLIQALPEKLKISLTLLNLPHREGLKITLSKIHSKLTEDLKDIAKAIKELDKFINQLPAAEAARLILEKTKANLEQLNILKQALHHRTETCEEEASKKLQSQLKSLASSLAKNTTDLISEATDLSTMIGTPVTTERIAGIIPEEKLNILVTTAPILKILVVDDNPLNRKILARFLKRKGYPFDEAGNGEEAVNQFSTGKYALCLMDLQMPIMDGFEATHKIREKEKGTTHHTYIVALSANDPVESKTKALTAGMDQYMSKPIDFDIIFKLILARVGVGAIISPTDGEGATPPLALLF